MRYALVRAEQESGPNLLLHTLALLGYYLLTRADTLLLYVG